MISRRFFDILDPTLAVFWVHNFSFSASQELALEPYQIVRPVKDLKKKSLPFTKSTL